jgi:hypothetical protein
VLHCLLEAFMTTVFQAGPTGPDEKGAAHQWLATRARPWLAFLARHLRRQRTQDFAWWRLPTAAGGLRLLSAVAFGLLCGVAFAEGAEVLRAPTGGLLFGLIAAVGFGLLFWLLGDTLPSAARAPAWRARTRPCTWDLVPSPSFRDKSILTVVLPGRHGFPGVAGV